MSYKKMMKWNKTHRKGISYKHGYMGFNPSGITSEQIVEREKQFVVEWKAKSKEERIEYWDNIKIMKEGWEHSYPWEWCAFERNFIFNNNVIF